MVSNAVIKRLKCSLNLAFCKTSNIGQSCWGLKPNGRWLKSESLLRVKNWVVDYSEEFGWEEKSSEEWRKVNSGKNEHVLWRQKLDYRPEPGEW